MEKKLQSCDKRSETAGVRIEFIMLSGDDNKVTVQPFISSIHKPASKLSVAAMQLLFIYAKAK